LLRTGNKFKKSFQSETKQIKNIITPNLKEKLEEKRMHGQFPRCLGEKLVDKEQSYRWLKFGDIKEKQKVQLWQLRIRQCAQTTLREKF
jgi:hypothetical protein